MAKSLRQDVAETLAPRNHPQQGLDELLAAQFRQGNAGVLVREYAGLVAVVEPNRALVLHVKAETLPTNSTEFDEATAGKYFSSGSSWILEEADGDTTRLISGWRTDYSPDSLGNRLS